METVVGLIPDDMRTSETRREMKSAGFTENDISVLRTSDDVWSHLDGRKKAHVVLRNVAIGSVFGLVLGILYGATTGFLNCTLMNCPNRSNMVFVVFIVLFCAFSGGFFGALFGLGQPNRLYSCTECVRRGQVLFVVETTDERAEEAIRILKQEGALLVEH
jgi:hypothetical protein